MVLLLDRWPIHFAAVYGIMMVCKRVNKLFGCSAEKQYQQEPQRADRMKKAAEHEGTRDKSSR